VNFTFCAALLREQGLRIFLTLVIPMCFLKYKIYMTVKQTYLFTNYTHSDMFRLERVIIWLSIEPYIRCMKC